MKKERDDYREGLEVWMECIPLLSTIAGADFDCYKNAFSGVQQASNKKKTEEAKSMLELDLMEAQRRLDELQYRWSFSGTTLPNLLQSIHRLQSNGCSLREESEQVSHDLHTAKQNLTEFAAHNRRLQNSVRKLYDQNTKLKEKLKRKQLERKSLIKNVGDYVATVQKRTAERVQQREEDQGHEISRQLRVHERLLRMQKYKTMDDSSPMSLNSADDYDVRDSGMCLNPSFDDDDAGSSVSSISSLRSLVTDDITSTVRLESSFLNEVYSSGKRQFEGRQRTRSDGDVSGWSALSFSAGGRKSNISQEILSMENEEEKGRSRSRTQSDSDVSISGWSSVSSSAKNKDVSSQGTISSINKECVDVAEEKSSNSIGLGSMFHLSNNKESNKKDTSSTRPSVSRTPSFLSKIGVGKDGKKTGATTDNEVSKKGPESSLSGPTQHTPSFFERIGVEKKEMTTMTTLTSDGDDEGCTKDASSTSTQPPATSRTPSFFAKMGVVSEKVPPVSNDSDTKSMPSPSRKMMSSPFFFEIER
uniref:Uncharacterized protein n=1 Tax=Ditylum brightwellii TaxID=49249 RepID=A0A7S4VUP6_9STRA